MKKNNNKEEPPGHEGGKFSAGNKYWTLRTKHGRDRKFKSPQAMMKAAIEYFDFIENNPFYKSEAKVINIGDYQSKVEIIDLPVKRPFTIQGLCQYLNCNVQYFNEFEESLKGREDAQSSDFSAVISCVREVIYDQKFSGAASGFFNANIIARDLGLQDRKDITSAGERLETKIVVQDESTKDELNKLIGNLKDKK